MRTTYPTDAEAKRDILEAGRRMYQKNFVAANDGNLSAKVSDSCVWATPTGISKGFMTEEILVKLDLDGRVVEGTHKPSSEIKMHLRIYKEVPEVRAVAHAHPPVAAAFAAAGLPLDKALLQEAVVLLGVIPVAGYALPGSEALAESVVPYLRDYNGLLLEHHGAVTWGESVMQALYRLESIEYNATVAMYTKMMGIERPLTNSQIDGLIALRPSWGVTGGGRPIGRD
ncbi:L-fuculose-phosphate aldolase [Sporobacter termitidis DSM 10068]|uniref:L-fuculose-phosphate aldolase n=1 Tax=Sporobacter termitidis DSM 10068 TaxID=1123282 RepID=A0A1M5Y6T1_9FIRM|nr:class II aldolase/adducin family protein [Sporobacter termitidis]SHI07790.1 L-fuculose-phosphate aldolase [Sporobacter termitidis DSM 10068]